MESNKSHERNQNQDQDQNQNQEKIQNHHQAPPSSDTLLVLHNNSNTIVRAYENSITGDELMELEDDRLKTCVMTNSIFMRMFPEAKLKIINALKSNHQIVAMVVMA